MYAPVDVRRVAFAGYMLGEMPDGVEAVAGSTATGPESTAGSVKDLAAVVVATGRAADTEESGRMMVGLGCIVEV